jgi:hypothetical protein
LQLFTTVDVGAKYDTDARDFSYDIQVKKTLPVTKNGLLSVDVKGGYNINPGLKIVSICNKSKLEFESNNIFNLTFLS